MQKMCIFTPKMCILPISDLKDKTYALISLTKKMATLEASQ